MKKLFFIISTLFFTFSFAQNTNKKIDKASSASTIIINCKTCSDCKTPKPLYILDDKIITEKRLKEINPKKIKSMNVYKHEKATLMYGEKGKNGVIVITTKTKKDLRKEKRKTKRKKKK